MVFWFLQRTLGYRFWCGSLPVPVATAPPLCDWAPECCRYWLTSAQLFCVIRAQLPHVTGHEDLCGTRQMDFIRTELCVLLQESLLTSVTEYTALHHKPVLHPAAAQRYLFSFPACLGLKSQLKTSLFCSCLIVFSLFPSPFAAVFRLSCVRVQLATVDVRGNKVSLCDVLEGCAPQPLHHWRMFATDLRNSRSHPRAQKSFQKGR